MISRSARGDTPVNLQRLLREKKNTLTGGGGALAHLKGVWHEIFDISFFHKLMSPGPLSIPSGPFRIFSKIAEIFANECVRLRPGLEWGAWGNPRELNWFLRLIKPLRCTRSLRDPAQTQEGSEQVWLDTTFISQGSWSWGKLAVETWRVKTELIIITILHKTTTTIINLKLRLQNNCAKNIGAHKNA
jgi:hypothetical protein